MRERKTSLNRRLSMLLAVCFVPMIIIIAYLMITLNRFSERYDSVVKNITKANEYNINFKDNLDYSMYIIVVNSERADELIGPIKPHEMIGQAREAFRQLYNEADSYAKSTLQRILKSLNTLEDRVSEIESDAQVVGMYEKNIERLDLNIRILTELIQEQIQEYIYYEAVKLEALRGSVRSDVLSVIAASMVLFGVILLGALLMSRKIMNSITEGIGQLRKVTRKAGQGDFAVRAQMEGSDEEMMELGDGFNQMVEHIGQLVEDIRIEQLNLRATEQKLLQAQINPHFLYNTLDAIIWMAEDNQKEQVITMVAALSDFFRTTLSNGRDYITVEEEASHIRSYLQIQQFRYQDILEYEIDIPAEMYSYQILKLTLQPLVENALYHGIKNKRGMGHICVKGYLAKNEMCFSVSDDGIGMREEVLRQVRSDMNREANDVEESSGFGLYNVQQRLKLNYGPEAGIWIHSIYGKGTKLEVRLPVRR